VLERAAETATRVRLTQMIAPDTPVPRLVQGLIRSFVQREAASAVRGFLDNVRRELERAGRDLAVVDDSAADVCTRNLCVAVATPPDCLATGGTRRVGHSAREPKYAAPEGMMMKALVEFLKSTLIGGLLIVVPTYLTVLLLAKALGGMVSLLGP